MKVSPARSYAATPSVLLVDGDADTRELYRESLVVSGWGVTEATNGREALVQAIIAPPAMIITELHLPIIDGISLCEILRRDRATAAIPILVVTAETRTQELERAERGGATAILIKPSTPEVVIAEMQRLVRESEAATAAGAIFTPSDRRTVLVKTHERYWTSTPSEPVLSLVCPVCIRPLKYQESFLGGVSQRRAERWDYYECSGCGKFQYRWRTRKLRRIS